MARALVSHAPEGIFVIPKPTCCAAMQKFPAIVASDDGSSQDTEKCGVRWYIRIAGSLRSGLVGYEEWERDMVRRPPHPKFCPFCGTGLPQLVLKEEPPAGPVEHVTDGGYYCDTCGERCGGPCRCLPTVARFRIEEGA